MCKGPNSTAVLCRKDLQADRGVLQHRERREEVWKVNKSCLLPALDPVRKHCLHETALKIPSTSPTVKL